MNAQTQLLALFIKDVAERGYWHATLAKWRAFSNVTHLENGWLVAERVLGSGRSQTFAKPQPFRFLIGEEAIATRTDGIARYRACVETTPERLAQFPGDFASVSFAANGQARVVRSASGIPNLYVASSHAFVALSTRLDWIGCVLPDMPALDWLPLSLFILGWPAFPERRSPLQHVRLVERGSVTETALGTPPSSTRYWRPEPHALPKPSREQTEHLASVTRQSLESTLKGALCASGENLLFFSGGLDSAAVAGMARKLGARMQAVSFLPPRGSQETAREQRYVSALDDYFAAHWVQTMDDPPALELERRASPSFYPLCHYWTLLDELKLAPKTIAGGWNADETLGVLRLPDWVRHARLRDLPLLWRDAPDPLHALRRWYHFRMAAAGDFLPIRLSRPVAALVGTEFRDFRRRSMRLPEASSDAPLNPRLLLTLRYADSAGIYAEEAARRDAVAVLPFFARPILEAACAAHPASLFENHRQKVPLRRAMTGLLASEYLTRTDSGDFTQHGPLQFLSPEAVSTLLGTASSQLDNARLSVHSRLSWEEQFELCLIHRISQQHQVLRNDRKEIRH